MAQNRATASRPWYSSGIGGIEMKTSSVSRATSASRSADSYALTNFATTASSAGEGGRGGQRAGRRGGAVGGGRARLLGAGAPWPLGGPPAAPPLGGGSRRDA